MSTFKEGSGMDERLKKLSPAQRAVLEQRLMERGTATARRNPIVRREVESPVPLSYAQELLWLLSQVFDDGVAYNAPGAFRLVGGGAGPRPHGPLRGARARASLAAAAAADPVRRLRRLASHLAGQRRGRQAARLLEAEPRGRSFTPRPADGLPAPGDPVVFRR